MLPEVMKSKLPSGRFLTLTAERGAVMAMFIIVSLYTTVIATVITPFHCISQPDGTSRIASSAFLRCYDSEWFSRLPLFIFFTLIYLVIFPFHVICVLLSMKTDPPRWVTRFYDSAQSRAKYDFLIRSYKSRFSWWEGVHIFKRAALVVSTGILSTYGGSSSKYYISILILLVFLLFDVLALPYKRPSLNKQSIV
jgi:hypothetical protein